MTKATSGKEPEVGAGKNHRELGRILGTDGEIEAKNVNGLPKSYGKSVTESELSPGVLTLDILPPCSPLKPA